MKRCLVVLAAAALVYAGCNSSSSRTTPNVPAKPLPNGMAGVGPGGVVTLNGENTKIALAAGSHTGGFKSLEGKIKMMQMSPGKSPPADERGMVLGIDVDVDAASLSTDDEKLTAQLKDDALKVKENPKITFTSTKVRTPDGKEDQMEVTGDLSVAGKKKSITFPVKASKERGFYLTGNFKLSRKELGMTSNPPQGKLDDEISVTVTVGVDPNAKTD